VGPQHFIAEKIENGSFANLHDALVPRGRVATIPMITLKIRAVRRPFVKKAKTGNMQPRIKPKLPGPDVEALAIAQLEQGLLIQRTIEMIEMLKFDQVASPEPRKHLTSACRRSCRHIKRPAIKKGIKSKSGLNGNSLRPPQRSRDGTQLTVHNALHKAGITQQWLNECMERLAGTHQGIDAKPAKPHHVALEVLIIVLNEKSRQQRTLHLFF